MLVEDGVISTYEILGPTWSAGHVPQTGVLLLDKEELVLKLEGRELILETHQPDKS